MDGSPAAVGDNGQEPLPPLRAPVLSDLTVQADTINGYTFWDQTGVIANEYSNRFQSINYTQPQGLVCSLPRDPADTLQSLRVNTRHIWLSYRADVSWTTVRQETPRLIDWIARAAFVTKFSRVGVRASLLFGGKDLEHIHAVQRERVLRAATRGWAALGNVTTGELVMNVESRHLAARIALDTVSVQMTEFISRNPGDAGESVAAGLDLPAYAIRLDVDMADRHPGESLDVKPHLNHSYAFLYDSVVPFVSQLLEEAKA